MLLLQRRMPNLSNLTGQIIGMSQPNMTISDYKQIQNVFWYKFNPIQLTNPAAAGLISSCLTNTGLPPGPAT